MNHNTTTMRAPRLSHLSRLALAAGAAAGFVGAGLATAQMGSDAHGSAPAPSSPAAASTPPAPSAPPAPPAPAPQPIRVREPGSGSTSGSMSASIVVNENGRLFKIEMKDSVVTSAEVDGRALPDSQIENDGETVRLKDDKGEVLYEYNFSGGGAGGAMGWLSSGGAGRAWTALDPDDAGLSRLFALAPGASGAYTINGQAIGGVEPLTMTYAAEPAEPPAVMMGVQLGSPDSALCGHLGIDRRKATLLTAVHDGLPAAAAGLEPYDLIVSVNGSDEAAPSAVRAALKEKKAGDSISLGVIHKGVRKDVTLTLEAYDRKRLSDSTVKRVEAGDEDFFAVAMAPGAPAAPLPPIPPSIPQEYHKQIEEYFKNFHGQAPRAYVNRFRAGTPMGGPQDTQRLLEQIERQQRDAAREAELAAKKASDLAERLAERSRSLGGSQPGADAMRERMERLEKMLERLMQEKLENAKPEQEPKDGGGRS